MTSFAPAICPFCHAEVVLRTSAETGKTIRLNPVPSPDGSFFLGYEEGRGRVARFIPKDMRTGKGDLWVAHAQTCSAFVPQPRRVRPRTLTLGFAATEGTPSELALARTAAHSAELQLERLADDLIAEWRAKCKREGWVPVWSLLQSFLGRRAGELPKTQRDQLSTVVRRRLHPAAAKAGQSTHALRAQPQ